MASDRLLSSLAELPADVLALVVDALALVRLGATLGADLGGNLADLLLGDALNGDVRVVGHDEADVLGGLVDDLVRVAEGEVQVLALERGTVAPVSSSFFSKPLWTPSTMLWSSVRVRPCCALDAVVSSLRTTWSSVPSSLMVTSSEKVRVSSPFSPLTVTVEPSMVTVTPAGTVTGCLPIRDIVSSYHFLPVLTRRSR